MLNYTIWFSSVIYKWVGWVGWVFVFSCVFFVPVFSLLLRLYSHIVLYLDYNFNFVLFSRKNIKRQNPAFTFECHMTTLMSTFYSIAMLFAVRDLFSPTLILKPCFCNQGQIICDEFVILSKSSLNGKFYGRCFL